MQNAAFGERERVGEKERECVGGKGLIYLKELPWGTAFMINVGVDYATNCL